MKKLTDEQQRILSAMRSKPDAIFTAEDLNASLATLGALDRRGLVSGAFGETRTRGAYRGRWYKLTKAGRTVTV